MGKMVSGVMYQVSADDRHQDPIVGGRESRDEREGLSSEALAKGDQRMGNVSFLQPGHCLPHS